MLHIRLHASDGCLNKIVNTFLAVVARKVICGIYSVALSDTVSRGRNVVSVNEARYR